jgi:hypothetical protein
LGDRLLQKSFELRGRRASLLDQTQQLPEVPALLRQHFAGSARQIQV